MRLCLPSTGTLGCVVWPGAGITCSQGVPPDFYPPHMNVGLTGLLLLPLHETPCPLSQLCVSTPPIHLDEYGFKSLVVTLPYSLVFWQFWVFFVLRLVVIILVVA